METLSITLPDEIVDAIRAKVEDGDFASTSEVVREALQLWLGEEEERAYEERMASIRARVKASLEDPRPSISSAEVRSMLDAHFAKHR